MDKVIIAPSKYIQGTNVIERLSEFTNMYGNSPLIIISKNGYNLFKDKLDKSFGKNYTVEIFNKECSKNEIDRISTLVKQNNVDYLIAVGGGKIIDTVKAVGYYNSLPIVVMPTIASTDAPTSALSVIYTDDGVFQEYLILKNNPDMVIMDLDIIANAPKRLLVAGMGDALSTYFEARACKRSNATTLAGGHSTNSALTLAKLCYDTLLEDGFYASISVEQKVVTKSLENVVEANTYLSGIGFESSGLAAAHAVHNGLTIMEELHHLYHGEKVAFGVLVQLVLENEMDDLETVLDFNRSVGLPTCFKDMGVENVDKEKLMEVAKAATVEGETIHNMPFEVTAESVYAAMLFIDKLGEL